MGSDNRETTLGALLAFSNGRSSPERADCLPYPVYGSNGVIGRTGTANAEAGSIVIGRVGSQCGSLYFTRQPCWVTDNAICATALEDNDPRFLFYLLSSLGLNSWRAGSGQPLLNQDILSHVPANVPPVPEQHVIAHVIGALDDKIELNRRMNETLEAMARALFKSWFIALDPVRAKIEGRDPGLPADIAALFPDSFQNSDVGDIPTGWAIGVFSDLVVHLREQESPLSLPDKLFSHYSLPAFDEGQSPTLEYGETIKSVKWRVSGEAVLLSKLNPEIERVWLMDVDPSECAVCSTEFLVLRARPPFTRSYVYCLARSPLLRQQIESLVTGTSKSHQRAQTDSILNLAVVVPPSPLVRVFDRFSASLLARTLECRNASHTLATLRDTLLPKLLSGELRVTEATPLEDDLTHSAAGFPEGGSTVDVSRAMPGAGE